MNARWLVPFVVGLSISEGPAAACGVNDPVVRWTSYSMPGPGLESYANGELGIVRGTFDSSVLLVGYRTLLGKPLTQEQQFQMVRIWRVSFQTGDPADTAGKDWSDALARLFELKESVQPAEGCGSDAYRQATRVLRDRQRRSPDWARAWAQKQCQVFARCPLAEGPPPSGADGCQLIQGRQTKAVGAPPRWFMQDAAYQDAVMDFRNGSLATAARAFREVADDRRSPWHEFARYMAARTWRNRVDAEGTQTDPQVLWPIATVLRGILRTSPSEETRGAAFADLVRLEGRLQSEGWEEEAARYLLSDNPSVPRLLAMYAGPSDPEEDSFDWFKAMREAEPDDGFDGKAAPERRSSFRHSQQKWQRSQTLPWLVATLVAADDAQKIDRALWYAAMELPETSPAWLTVSYHLARLMVLAGQSDQARTRLDAVLNSERKMDPSSQTLFARLRGRIPLNAATAFQDALRRTPAWVEEDLSYLTASAKDFLIVDEEALEVFSSCLTSAQLLESARAPFCPAKFRGPLTRMVWARAALVGDAKTAREAAADLDALGDLLSPSLARWRKAGTEEDRRVDALVVLAKHSRLSPYGYSANDYLANWWCPRPGKLTPNVPKEDDATEEQALRSEVEALNRLEAAQDFFLKAFLALGPLHPHDERIAEGLHYAVNASRYGCVDQETNGLSRRAFQYLHRQFPKSNWAKETPYWY